MDIARVIGTVVAERKEESLRGVQLCLIEPLDEHLRPARRPIVASESTSPRSAGDVIYYVASGDAAWTHPEGRPIPVDAAIVGLVDHIDSGGRGNLSGAADA